MSIRLIGALSSALFFAGSTAVFADEYYPDSQTTSSPRGDHWWSGDWYLTLGAKGFVAPRYEGAKDYLLSAAPVISLGRAGKFSSFFVAQRQCLLRLHRYGRFPGWSHR